MYHFNVHRTHAAIEHPVYYMNENKLNGNENRSFKLCINNRMCWKHIEIWKLSKS